VADKYQAPPERTLPNDEFTATRRSLTNHPGAFAAGTTVHVSDDYGNLVTWVVETFRVDGSDTILLQRNAADGGARYVLPPQVCTVLAGHRDRVVAQSRRRAARQGAATRQAKKR
jgi:hypothetical protein